LARSIPVKVHLGEDLKSENFDNIFPRLYKYIDLSNEQVFLRMYSRVSRSTWINWCEGIKTNLSHRAFAQAWQIVKKQAVGSFEELRRPESSGFAEDPRAWLSWYQRYYYKGRA
jgi:hypothetical protein